MSTPDDVITALEHLAPLRLAAEWDNVGFLVGTKRPTIQRVMTCLTLTMEIAREAVSQKADLIVTHHPLPFRPVNRITEATATGRDPPRVVDSRHRSMEWSYCMGLSCTGNKRDAC